MALHYLRSDAGFRCLKKWIHNKIQKTNSDTTTFQAYAPTDQLIYQQTTIWSPNQQTYFDAQTRIRSTSTAQNQPKHYKPANFICKCNHLKSKYTDLI